MRQEELVAIYDQLRVLLRSYESETMTPKFDIEGKYDLWSHEEGIVVNGKPRKEVFFAGLIIQSSYVGFYFMPVYADAELESVFSERLLALKKGKSCFHVKRTDAELLQDIAHALSAGFELYRERGWV